MCDPRFDGRTALRAAEHPVDAPAGERRPAASQQRQCPRRRCRRPVHERHQLRDAAAIARCSFDYRTVLEKVYDPAAYAGRLDRLGARLKRSERGLKLSEGDLRGRVKPLETVRAVVDAAPGAGDLLWASFMKCARNNPVAVRYIVFLMAMYIYLGPFSRRAIEQIDRRIAAIDAAEQSPMASSGVVIERSSAAGASLH